MSSSLLPGQQATSSGPSLEEVAGAAGATDLFLFRRVGGDRFAHVGGCGRGAGWAGIVEIGVDEEPLFSRAVADGRLVRRDTDQPEHAFGPYYARSVVIAPTSHETFAVFGSQEQPLAQLSAAEYAELGGFANGVVAETSAAKRLADELELVNVVRDLLSAPACDLTEALDSIVASATDALSCELGILYVADPERLAVASRGFAPPSQEELIEVMRRLAARRSLPQCVQDATANDLPRPLSSSDGVTSYYLLELSHPLPGLLLLTHTRLAPRGFTTLCQTLGLRLVEAAGTVLATAVAREQLQNEVVHAAQQARRDLLTGLANRLAWSEATAELRSRPPQVASVVTIDCRGLKRANDEHGHQTGDLLLQSLASLLTGCVREEDLVARIGGDEFVILLRDAGEATCGRVVERIGAAIESYPRLGPVELAISLGWATTDPPEHDVDDAHRRADAELRRDKQRS